MAVAALKHGLEWFLSVLHRPVLHGLMAVAALKLCLCHVRHGADLVLHGLMAVAALKRSGKSRFRGLQEAFSTASWPWPH